MDRTRPQSFNPRSAWLSAESMVFSALLLILGGVSAYLWQDHGSGLDTHGVMLLGGFFVVGAALSVRLYHESGKRRIAEFQQARVRKQLGAVMDQLPALLWTTDRRLQVTSASGAALGILSPEQTTVADCDAATLFASSKGVRPVIEAHRKALDGEASQLQIEANGSLLGCRLEPMRNAAGTIVGCLGVGMDITELKSAELALSKSEERYRDLVDNSEGYICTHDLDGVVLSVNPAAAASIGLPQGQCVGHSMSEFLMPEVREHFPLYLHKIKTEGSATGLMRIMNKTGQERIWHYFNTLAHDAAGEDYVVGHAHDVTERVQAERKLRQSEQRFRDFAETAADFFWEQDANLRFTYVSKRSFEVMGISWRDLIGASWDELLSVHGHPDGSWEKDLRSMATHGPLDDVELKWTRPDGETRVMRLGGRPVYDGSGVFSGYRGVSRDVTQSHQLTEQIAYQASHDHLTGLLNRREFEARVQDAVTNAIERGSQHAVCYMDLDQFKLVNDTAGHGAGDELLRSLVEFLQHLIRRGDTLARLGGDEFGLLLENCTQANAVELAQSIVDCVRRFRFSWKDQNFTIGISVGVAPIRADTESAIQVMSQSDVACYTAKDLGRNRIHIYDATDSEPARLHEELFQAADLHEALAEDRFEIHAQPMYYLGKQEKRLHHYELLIRLVDKSGNLVAPGKFLPAAERYGMMSAVDRWVVKYTCRTFGSKFQLPPDVGLSLNLSRSSLLDESLIDEIIQEINQSPLSGNQICFDISESTVSLNPNETLRMIVKLKSTGCEVALDDFGSGLSSFAYLKSLPVEYLKIDGAFIQDMASDSIDRSMITMINDVGHMIGTKTVAKSVETEENMLALRKLGIDFVQGYYFGRPAPVDEMFKTTPQLRSVSG